MVKLFGALLLCLLSPCGALHAGDHRAPPDRFANTSREYVEWSFWRKLWPNFEAQPEPLIPGFLYVHPDQSLMAAIPPRASAQRRAALRLAEEGRRLLDQGDHERALLRLEKALSLDRSPYIYYYLGRVHYDMGQYDESLKFLEVANIWLAEDPLWWSEISSRSEIGRRDLAREISRERSTRKQDPPGESAAASEARSAPHSDPLVYVYLAAALYPIFLLLVAILRTFFGPEAKPVRPRLEQAIRAGAAIYGKAARRLALVRGQ